MFPIIFVTALTNTAPPVSMYQEGDTTHAWAVTEWYEAEQLPVRSGVYEVADLGPAFCYFDGANWYEDARTPNEALRKFQMSGVRGVAGRRWRGLTERYT